MNDHGLPQQPDFNDNVLASQDCSGMAQLQQFKLGFYLKAICHTLLGHKKLKRGQKRDQRKSRIPECLKEGIKALLIMFAVDPATHRRLRSPELFRNELWRETSYAEIASLRSDDTLTTFGIKYMLRVLEEAGVIERYRTFDAANKTSKVFIRFNAVRFLEILEGAEVTPAAGRQGKPKNPGKGSQQAKEEKPAKDEAQTNEEQPGKDASEGSNSAAKPQQNEKTSAEINCPNLGLVFSGAPAAVPGAVAGLVGPTQRDSQAQASAPPAPGQPAFLSEPEQAWERFSYLFPEATREKYHSKLVRRLNHPIPEQRLTLPELKSYCKLWNQQFGTAWYYNLGPDMFLRCWSRLRCIVHSELNFHPCREALEFFKDLDRALPQVTRKRRYLVAAFHDRAALNPGTDLVELLLQCEIHHGLSPFEILLTAHDTRLDMAAVLERIRPGFRQWALLQPTYFLKLAAFLPVKAWAAFSGKDFDLLVRKSEAEHLQACHLREIADLYYCPELSHETPMPSACQPDDPRDIPLLLQALARGAGAVVSWLQQVTEATTGDWFDAWKATC